MAVVILSTFALRGRQRLGPPAGLLYKLIMKLSLLPGVMEVLLQCIHFSAFILVYDNSCMCTSKFPFWNRFKCSKNVKCTLSLLQVKCVCGGRRGGGHGGQQMRYSKNRN